MQALRQHCAHHLLVWVALCSLCGAGVAWLLGVSLDHALLLMVALPLMAVLVIIGILVPPATRVFLPLPFFLLLGMVHTHGALQPPSASDHLFHRIPEKTRATVVGTILDMPEYNGSVTRLLLECESLLLPGPGASSSFQPVRGRLQLTVQDRLPPTLTAGSRVMAIATIDRIHRYQTPGTFDYQLHMAAKGILCSAWVESAHAMELVAEHPESASYLNRIDALRFFPEQIRQHTAAFLEQHLDREVAGVFQALLIGSMANISPHTLEAFKASGCFHVLSISGLHFSLLGLFTLGLITWALKRSQWLLLHTHVPTLALALTAPVLLGYVFIAGMNVPALRAVVTAMLVLTAVLLRRQRTMLPLIAAAALLVLAFHPLSLMTASFQLSFAAVLAINLIYPRLPLFTAVSQDQPTWHRLLQRSGQTILSMLYVSLAATAGTLPLVLLHFNRFPLLGPVLNLVIEPLLCLWALPAGLMALLLLPLFPSLAAHCLQFGSLGVKLTLWLLDPLPQFSALSMWTITPSIFEITGYLLVLWLILHRPALPHRLPMLTLLSLLLAASFTASLWKPWPGDQSRIHFIDVGQGSSTLLQLPDGTNLLVDGGGYRTDRFDTGQQLIAPFLWFLRLWRIDTIVITHPHGDHYNALPFLVERFHPRRLIINGDTGEEDDYTELLHLAHQLHIPVTTATAGTVLAQGEGFAVRCLGMPGLEETSGWSTNDRSLVVSLKHHDRNFLLPADIGIPSEQVLVASGADLRAEVLLAPHHGSPGSASLPFIAAVNPAMIVVSAGRQRQGVLPAPQHLHSWHQHHRLPLVTAQAGTVTCLNDHNNLRVTTFTGQGYEFDKENRVFKPTK
jgi:competence protein ComEC